MNLFTVFDTLKTEIQSMKPESGYNYDYSKKQYVVGSFSDIAKAEHLEINILPVVEYNNLSTNNAVLNSTITIDLLVFFAQVGSDSLQKVSEKVHNDLIKLLISISQKYVNNQTLRWIIDAENISFMPVLDFNLGKGILGANFKIKVFPYSI